MKQIFIVLVPILLICSLFFNCTGDKSKEELDITTFMAQGICQCADDLYSFNLVAKRTLPEAKGEEKAKILREAERQMDSIEKCIIREMGKKRIKKGEIEFLLLEKEMIESCTNKDKNFVKQLLIEMKGLL